MWIWSAPSQAAHLRDNQSAAGNVEMPECVQAGMLVLVEFDDDQVWLQHEIFLEELTILTPLADEYVE